MIAENNTSWEKAPYLRIGTPSWTHSEPSWRFFPEK